MSLESSQASGGSSGATTTTVFDPEYRYTPYERIEGKSATDILKQVDKILQSTSVVLENHKDFLPTDQFRTLKKAYCRYHWQMTNESQEDRAYFDKRIRESRILSQLYANRQTHQDRARVLLYEVETFQTRVLSASRNAHNQDALVLFEDEMTESPAQSRSSTLDSFTSWFSVFGKSSRVDPAEDTETSKPRSEPAAPADDSEALTKQAGRFIVSVTHFPKPPNEPAGGSEVGSSGGVTVGTGNHIYRRMIAFENNSKRIEIIDPNLYALEGSETYIGENVLQAMSELGQRWLNQSELGIPSDSQITAEVPSQIQPLETIIQKFRKISVSKP